MIYRHQGQIGSRKLKLGVKRNKSESFSSRKAGFRD